MIELTEQQVCALEQAQTSPPRLVNPKTQQRFVLLPEVQYAQLAAYDGDPWSDEERDLLRAEALDALGWEGIEAYQESHSGDHLKTAGIREILFPWMGRTAIR